MKTRRPKSIVTDYRPPIVGEKTPLERKARPGAAACLDPWDRAKAAEAAAHDKNVVGHSVDTLLAMVTDLGRRKAWNPRDPEQRWVMGRIAAVHRRLDSIKTTLK